MSRLLLLLAVLAGASPARAERDVHESVRTTYVELRLGFYRPEIDSEFKESSTPGNTRPYERIFGSDRDPLFQLVLEKHLFQRFGSLSAGLSAGYWSVEGDGIPPAGAASSEATDTTELVVVPLQAQLTYRFDEFEDSLPLVPVLRGGVDYYLWKVLDGSGETTEFEDGKEADGATWGWHYALGVHLLLDYLAPDMAADFDRDAGVNSSYLTFEYQKAQVDDFGSDDSFRLGDGTFFFGLTLDM